jgi:hypothetical protein
MAKFILQAVLDAALNYIKTNVAEEHVCTSQPTTRTEATTTFNLATVAFLNASVTLAAGDVSGRKATMAAKSGVAISASGTAQHVALTSATELLLVTTCTSQALSSGGTVDIPSFKYEINAPA